MKERPILMSAPMVRSLLDGSKTQTRRVVKMPASWDCIVYADWGSGWWPYRSDDGESPNYDNNEIPLNCPYGQAGDRLWVRETHRPVWGQTPGYLTGVDYRADPRERWERLGDQIGTPLKWTPSLYMRREHSRILLEITSVRVERLQDIGVEDIEAEGVATSDEVIMEHGCRARVLDYQRLWESINGAGSWGANPWVWVVEFRRIAG